MKIGKPSYGRHPLSAAYPSMPDDQFGELVEDIRQHGQHEPAVLHEGMVIDGWHRYQACEKVGIDCRFVNFEGSDPATFVIRKNTLRRHLSEAQRAITVVTVRAWRPANTKGEPAQNGRVSIGHPSATVEQMATEAGVSKSTIQRAKKAHDAGLSDAIRDGNASLPRREKPSKILPRNLPPEKEPENYGPDDEEIAMLEERDRIERASFDKLIQSDDALAAATAEIKRLAAELAVVKQQRDGYMNRCNELIRQVRSLKREAARA